MLMSDAAWVLYGLRVYAIFCTEYGCMVDGTQQGWARPPGSSSQPEEGLFCTKVTFYLSRTHFEDARTHLEDRGDRAAPVAKTAALLGRGTPLWTGLLCSRRGRCASCYTLRRQKSRRFRASG